MRAHLRNTMPMTASHQPRCICPRGRPLGQLCLKHAALRTSPQRSADVGKGRSPRGPCKLNASLETKGVAGQSITVRSAMLSELDDVAWLRAEAFYEDQPHLRYVGSFKRQFMDQEARSLRDRTRHKQGRAGPDCVCLVAVKEDDSRPPEVVGTLDVEHPGSALAQDRKGVFSDSTYVRNVVVSCKHRRQGIGNILMAAAADMAKQEWGSTGMCAHVSAQNDAAIALYEACGYHEVSQETISSGMPATGGSLLGKQLFMVAPI